MKILTLLFLVVPCVSAQAAPQTDFFALLEAKNGSGISRMLVQHPGLANVRFGRDARTPLIYFVKQKDTQLVELFLKHKADPTCTTAWD